MNYTLTIRQYPNRELRAVMFRQHGRRQDVKPDLINDPNSKNEPHGSSPLDISSKVSEGLRPGFGGVPTPTRFGLNAKRAISRACGVFDRDRIPPSEMVFLTGTIPGSTREAFDAMACWSSWVVKAVKTWISDAGITSAYSLYVWEYQKRGALHIHYCLHVPDDERRQWVLSNWKAKWSNVLDAVSEKSGVDMWSRGNGRTWAANKSVLQADAQVVRNSVGGYLSKYLSKNAVAPSPGRTGTTPNLCPVRWWGVSRPLMKRFRELTEEIIVEDISFGSYRYVWEKVCEHFRGFADGYHEYRDKIGIAQVVVGFGEDWELVYHYLWRRFHHGRRIVATSPSV